MIHLVFGAAATGSLKYTFRKQSQTIIGFPINFSVGPITNIHEQSGINKYFTWVKSSFHYAWGYSEDNQIVYQQSLQKLLEIEDGQQVTIWTCENATEQIGLRICCYLLKGKKIDLSIVNTFDAMKDYTKYKDVEIDILQTGECNAEQLAYFYKNLLVPISLKNRNALEQEGQRLLQSLSSTRSWRQGKIINELETRDDPFILDCAKRIHDQRQNQDFIIATRVIGEVIGNSEEYLSDAWIEYRIRSLIDAGQLLYEGNLESMRMYKIKVV